ncbi:hypothetical protein FLA4_06900 [Candidatus Rickettsia kotlanii]|nr:hypothetical protein FLA4_06900 [Candidatus Rickettsia kotlanii]BDU61523.1 hypothetical protein HM2_06910 [Candidatus Rickettsia kotlanii]
MAPQCKVVEIDHGTTPSRSFYKRMENYMSCDLLSFLCRSEEHLEDDILMNLLNFLEVIYK